MALLSSTDHSHCYRLPAKARQCKQDGQNVNSSKEHKKYGIAIVEPMLNGAAPNTKSKDMQCKTASWIAVSAIRKNTTSMH